MDQTRDPFPKALKKLLKSRDLSQRALAREVKRYKGPHIATINFMIQGDIKPSQESIATIAKALDIDPRFFAEYRLAEARERLDPEVVGLKAALGNLAQLEK